VGAWWLWVRTDAARRWRPALVLVLLVALAGGAVLAAVAGGRRNGTAVERATVLTSPSTVWVLPNQPGFDWDAVRELPGVDAVGEFPVTFFEVDGFGPQVGGFPPGSPEAATLVDRPLADEGRLAEPDRDDEVTISQRFAAEEGVRVGDTLTIAMLTPEAGAAAMTGGPATTEGGPRHEVRVVGVAKGAFFAADVQPTYAFFERFRGNLVPEGAYINAVVRLEDGTAGIPAFEDRLTEVAGGPVEMRDAAADLKRLTNATHLERDALYGFAVAAGLATLVLVGQAVVRMVASAAGEVPLLVALGFTRRRAATALAALPAAALAAGVAGAGVVAWAASGLFPIGVGRQAEPHPGRHLDLAVLAPGVGLLGLVGVGGALAVTFLALRRRAPGAGAAAGGRGRAGGASGHTGSRLAAAVGATNAPVPLVLGVRLALERGDGRTSVPVRPALVGAVVGVLGVVGALTFGAGLDRASEDAGLYGQSFDAMLWSGNGDPGPALDALAGRDEVAMAARADNAIVTVAGRDVSAFAFDVAVGDLGGRALRGRLPAGDDELALAPGTLDSIGVDVGDVVAVGPDDLRFTVTGTAFTPEVGHTPYDSGATLTPDGMARLAPTADDLKFRTLLVRFDEGLDPEATIAALNDEVAGGLLEGRMPNEDQANLRGVRGVPTALGAFLAVLAVGAVGHALASTVRRRRRDLAVLRVLGLTRGQARATVACQATTLALVGLVLGAPAGVAIGRLLWQLVAEQAPLRYVPPLALTALLLVPPLAVAVSNAVAAWPAHVAARLRPADSLRTE
jgi:ABC-type lipoprotein release transport system permease subunit